MKSAVPTMGRALKKVIAALPIERQERIEARYRALKGETTTTRRHPCSATQKPS